MTIISKTLILLTLIVGLGSCLRKPVNSWGYDVITTIRSDSRGDDLCIFYTAGKQMDNFENLNAFFVCDCSKFKVGDTIKIVKYK